MRRVPERVQAIIGIAQVVENTISTRQVLLCTVTAAPRRAETFPLSDTAWKRSHISLLTVQTTVTTRITIVRDAAIITRIT